MQRKRLSNDNWLVRMLARSNNKFGLPYSNVVGMQNPYFQPCSGPDGTDWATADVSTQLCPSHISTRIVQMSTQPLSASKMVRYCTCLALVCLCGWYWDIADITIVWRYLSFLTLQVELVLQPVMLRLTKFRKSGLFTYRLSLTISFVHRKPCAHGIRCRNTATLRINQISWSGIS
jgi:hypothetical protein